MLAESMSHCLSIVPFTCPLLYFSNGSFDTVGDLQGKRSECQVIEQLCGPLHCCLYILFAHRVAKNAKGCRGGGVINTLLILLVVALNGCFCK